MWCRRSWMITIRITDIELKLSHIKKPSLIIALNELNRKKKMKFFNWIHNGHIFPFENIRYPFILLFVNGIENLCIYRIKIITKNIKSYNVTNIIPLFCIVNNTWLAFNTCTIDMYSINRERYSTHNRAWKCHAVVTCKKKSAKRMK